MFFQLIPGNMVVCGCRIEGREFHVFKDGLNGFRMVRFIIKTGEALEIGQVIRVGDNLLAFEP